MIDVYDTHKASKRRKTILRETDIYDILPK